MPIIDMPVNMLLARIAEAPPGTPSTGGPKGIPGRSRAATPGPRLAVSDLIELFPKLGCEVEELAQMQEYACRVCGRIYDRTDAQGAPLHCSNCGADFRADPQLLRDLGQNQVIRLNMLAVRPDIFDPGGMARYVRGYLGIQTGLSEYVLAAARLRVQVDPQLAQPDSLRPFISCAVVRNVRLDNGTIKMVMNLQEDLHWALGRDRKLASIGVYDLDTLAGGVLHYDAVDPDSVRFVPLGFPPAEPSSRLTPREILARHKTGQAYAHLLTPLKKYPLLRDAAGTVLSMPPIINSEATRVTLQTRQFFIDVTGLAQRTVDRALNIVVTSLLETMPQIQIECVVIESAGAARITPDLAPTELRISVPQAAQTIGTSLNAAELAELLESMGHAVEEGSDRDTLRVLVPAYRNDVLHPVDLIEDAAVAYGFENLTPRLVPTFTVGAPRAIEEQSTIARRILTGLGFHQVMTLVLTSEPAAFGKWRLPPDPRAVHMANPISVEQTICRVSLLPGLLETLAINKQYDLPQHVFEVGDGCFVDATAETGAREERLAAAAMIGTHVGYSDIRAVADAFVHELDHGVRVAACEHPSFIPGRVAEVRSTENAPIGIMGEIHPAVLEAYGLKHPTAVFEFSLAAIVGG